MIRARIFYYSVRLLLNPQRIEVLLKLGDALARLPGFEKAAALALENPELHALARERYVGPHPASAELRALPAGTLGHEYAKFLEANALRPYALYPHKPAVKKDGEYLKERARYLHDVAHVVLGRSVSLEDEAALNTFLLAQISSPISALIVTGYLLRVAFTNPTQLRPMFDQVTQSWQQGRGSPGFLSFRWEEHWERPLPELRRLWLLI